jgi:hypothetical protein
MLGKPTLQIFIKWLAYLMFCSQTQKKLQQDTINKQRLSHSQRNYIYVTLTCQGAHKMK